MRLSVGTKAVLQRRRADVAELVDARDLKSIATIDLPIVFWKTPIINTTENDRTNRVLENASQRHTRQDLKAMRVERKQRLASRFKALTGVARR
jgi:hypothetical protein